MSNKVFSAVTPLVAPAVVAGRLGVSVNAVTSTCRTLGVEYSRNPPLRVVQNLLVDVTVSQT